MSLPYTPDQIKLVRLMFERGREDHEIGEALGRPPRGIEKLRNKLGLRRDRQKPVESRVYQHRGVVGDPIYSTARQYLCPLRKRRTQQDIIEAFRAGFRGEELLAAATMRANGVEWG